MGLCESPASVVGSTLPSNVMNAAGLSLACVTRYCWPPASSSAPRIISFSALVILFGDPLRDPPGGLCPLVVHPASRMRLFRVWSVTRSAGPGWGGCDDPSGARVERGGGTQAGADDALTETGCGAGSPGADHPARG